VCEIRKIEVYDIDIIHARRLRVNLWVWRGEFTQTYFN
jgi:hypothetical protein